MNSQQTSRFSFFLMKLMNHHYSLQELQRSCFDLVSWLGACFMVHALFVQINEDLLKQIVRLNAAAGGINSAT